MLFTQPPREDRYDAPRRRSGWRTALLLAAATGVAAATQPWLRVRFDRLFGDLVGPPGWHANAGFTCLCTCALIGVLTLSESRTRRSQQAVRPACLLLAGLMFAVLLQSHAVGPGRLRGVTATWTGYAYLALAAGAGLLAACATRLRQLRRRERGAPAAGD